MTGFWQISVLRTKIASMSTSTEVTGVGIGIAMVEDGLVKRSTWTPRRRIVVRLHGSLSKDAEAT